jgi:YD repeat-containing protein
MPDAIQEAVGPSDPGAWKNPYIRPVIQGFPDGLAAETSVTYVTTTAASDGAPSYLDDMTTEPSTKLLTIPVTVVSAVKAEDKSGTHAGQDTTTYTYHSLRQDSFGRGPLGFRQVEVFDQASKVKTVTTYAQAYPYTGVPIQVDKFQRVDTATTQIFHQVAQTKTMYCDSVGTQVPPFGCGDVSGQPFPSGLPGRTFVYPSRIETISFLHPESDDGDHKTTTVSTFSFDSNGNSTVSTTTTTKVEVDPATGTDQTEQFSSTVTSQYVGTEENIEGKPTLVTTTTTGGTKSVTHMTAFEYAPVSTFGGASSTRLALSKTELEHDAGYPSRVDTAYRYDQFGNVITTTTCASDFDDCEAGAVNSNSSNDPAHPPFRTSTVTYNPAAAGLTVTYGVGRFPVRTTNPAGHTETTVYDPILGVALSRTGPNGIETCYEYDRLGRETAQIERCNSSTPLITTTQRVYAPVGICVDQPCSGAGFALPYSTVITISTPPTGGPRWAYTNDQGKTVGTLSYAFDGGFIETTTEYNSLGQVIKAAKPFYVSTLGDDGSPAYTKTQYDDYHRVWIVSDDLAVIDDSGDPGTATSTTTYSGSTSQTDRIVHAHIGGVTTSHTQTRLETKNALGKVATVTLSMPGNTMASTTYSYDADGNPTVIQDAAGNLLLMAYDSRGRKTSMSDPDMGNWSYVLDGFGDLVTQTDGQNHTTSMTYDALGRMVTKADGSGTAEWLYDVAPGAGKGKLAAMVGAPDSNLDACVIPNGFDLAGGNRAVKTFQYTAAGDVAGVAECADGATFVTSYQYDALGRQSQIRYPLVGTNQLAVGYHYSSLGYLQYLTDDSSDRSVLWQATAVNALGQVTDERMRNGVETCSVPPPSRQKTQRELG